MNRYDILDRHLALMNNSERYVVLEQLWIWGTSLSIIGAVLLALALRHLI